jgi:hypothetical protein
MKKLSLLSILFIFACTQKIVPPFTLSDLETADFTQDGIAELIGASNNQLIDVSSDQVLATLPEPILAMSTGDLDGDGVPEIVVALRNQELHTFLYDGVTLTETSLTSTLGQPIDLSLIDLNNDGALDVAVSTTAQIELFFNLAGILVAQPPLAISRAAALFVGDINKNGEQDFFITVPEGGAILLAKDTGGVLEFSQLAAPGLLSSRGGKSNIALGDWNADGLSDLAYLSEDLQVNLLLNQGGESFLAQRVDLNSQLDGVEHIEDYLITGITGGAIGRGDEEEIVVSVEQAFVDECGGVFCLGFREPARFIMTISLDRNNEPELDARSLDELDLNVLLLADIDSNERKELIVGGFPLLVF